MDLDAAFGDGEAEEEEDLYQDEEPPYMLLSFILTPMIVPPRALVGNVRSYFSGHYQRYGVNVQAIVDHHCRFIYMAVAAPGSQPDINALNRTNLPDVLSALLLGFFIIGDNAYPASVLRWLLV